MIDAGATVTASAGWLRRLAVSLRRYRRALLIAALAAVGVEVVAVAVPLVERSVIDGLGHHTRSGLVWPVALLVAAGLVRFGLGFVQRYWTGQVSVGVQTDLRNEIFAHVHRLDFARHDQLETGQLVSRANSDIGLIQGLFYVAPVAVAAVLFFVLAAAVMFVLNPVLAAVLLSFTPAMALLSAGVRRQVFPAAWAAQQDAGVVAGVVDEAVSGVRVVKGFGQEDRELHRLADAAAGLYASRVRSVRISCRFGPTLRTIPALGQVAVLALGGWMVITGRLTLGSFLAFASYVAMLQAPVRLLVGVLPFAQQARAGAIRVFELLDSTPGIVDGPDTVALGPVRGEVEFDSVSFGYRRSQPVLDGFNLHVRAGETVALVGLAGCGKSTAGLLVPRFYDVQTGMLRVDGVDVRGVTIESLRTQIGVVFEDTVGRMDKAAPPGGPGGQSLVVGAMVATPELLAQVAGLRAARDRPDVAVDDAARPTGPFAFARFLRQWRWQLAVALILVTLDGLAALASPVFVRYGIDRGVVPRSEHALMFIAALALGVVLLDWLVALGEVFVTGRTAERILYALRVRVFAHLQRLSLDFYDREMAGRIMTRMTNDIEALTQLLQTGLVNAVVSALTGVGVAAVLLVLDWRLALLAMAVGPPLVAATVWFRRSARRADEQARDKVAAVNADFQEGLSGIRVTQAFSRERRNARHFTSLAFEYLRARLRNEQLAATYFPFVDLLAEAAAAIVLGSGAALVSDGSLSPGKLIAFLLYLDMFFSPIQALSQVFDMWQQAAVAIDRITELLDTPVRTPPAIRPHYPTDRLRGDIWLHNVSFHYPDTEAEVLSDLTLHIPAGQTLALVGETGAGKSTIVKLVARFYDIDQGQLTIDGVDVCDYDLSSYRHQLGIVGQEPFLFAGIVRDNIAYGRPDATAAEVEAAARAVGAHQLVAGLPGGYHHVIGSSGLTLSAGQRQLLALARAHLVDPAILLLDEATSNLDPVTEAAVAAAMSSAAAGRTTVVIAHRLSTAARADRIAVIDHGRLVEYGHHRELLRANGHYAALWHTTARPAATTPAGSG